MVAILKLTKQFCPPRNSPRLSAHKPVCTFAFFQKWTNYCLHFLIIYIAGEKVQFWYDKKSTKQWASIDDVFSQLFNSLSSVCECSFITKVQTFSIAIILHVRFLNSSTVVYIVFFFIQICSRMTWDNNVINRLVLFLICLFIKLHKQFLRNS